MTTRTRIKCSGCGKRIPNSEPDFVLRRDGSTKVRYFHQHCLAAAQRIVVTDPDVWLLTSRHVEGELN